MSIWALPARISLRRLLTVPYVVLVLALVALIGSLSYRTARDTVDTLSGQLLIEAVSRISVLLDRHIGGSEAVLETAFPSGVAAPSALPASMQALRTRFWLATSVHRDPNNYAYFGGSDGSFFGLLRFSASEAELRWRAGSEGPRTLYRFTGMAGELREPVVENKHFDPRERPWFKAAQGSAGGGVSGSAAASVWSPVYLDFKTRELVATRARRVLGAQGEFAGVVATDLSLKQVNAFLARLALSPNAIAMVVEADGQLIGVSRGPHLKSLALGEFARLNAAESADALVRGAYQAVRAQGQAPLDGHPRTASFVTPEGDTVQIGFARLADEAGLDWLIVVAVPRFDFLGDVHRNFWHTGLLAALAAAVAVAIGLGVLSIVTRELRRLAEAAGRVGDGLFDAPVTTRRQDELGDLARSFAEMQRRLLTDQLTGLSNRSAILHRIEERIVQQRRRGDERPFVVMFADFNRFKEINDRFGHDVGDAVLREMGARLRASARAGDMVARYAGDEFVLLLESVDSRADADAARAHLETAMRAPLAALAGLGAPVNHGASIGLALYPEDGLDTDSLLKQADLNMYARKQARDDPTPAQP